MFDYRRPASVFSLRRPGILQGRENMKASITLSVPVDGRQTCRGRPGLVFSPLVVSS